VGWVVNDVRSKAGSPAKIISLRIGTDCQVSLK
jgi:hypothetical protein